jgi:hypothetical protein
MFPYETVKLELKEQYRFVTPFVNVPLYGCKNGAQGIIIIMTHNSQETSSKKLVDNCT